MHPLRVMRRTHASLLNEKKVIIKNNDEYDLPTSPEQNCAGAPLLEIMDHLNDDIGFEVTITKNIKPGN